MKMYVRWLGYITRTDKHISLKKSISFEILRKDEAACEPVIHTSGVAGRNGCCVGLMLRKEAIFREFYGDCWSYYGKDRKKSSLAHEGQSPKRLYAGKPRKGTYGEAFAHMDNAVEAIVVYGGLAEAAKAVQDSVLWAAQAYHLPVYALRRNGKVVMER